MALIIKSLTVDPPNYDELSDDEDDFVKDPAQYRDELPQPFRLIDNILTLFLDDVWDEITARENARVAERSKIRPPKYECSIQLQENPGTKALAESCDGRYVFAGSPGNLSIINASSRQTIHTYEDEKLDVNTLHCTIINIETYILTAIDELGLCRLYAVTAEKVFPMKIINDEQNNSKYHASKFKVSQDGDYLGILLECPGTNDSVLEVYQLPRDVWIKELEDVKNKLIQEEAKGAQLVTSRSASPTGAGEVLSTEAEVPLIAPEEESEPKDDKETAEDLENQTKKSTDSKTRFVGKSKAFSKKKSDMRSSRSGSRLSTPGKSMDPAAKPKSPGRRSTSEAHRAESASRKGSAMSKSARTSGRNSRRRKAGSKKGTTFKFTPPTAVMKQHPPTKLIPNMGTSAASTQSQVGDPKVMGSGQGHMLTRTYEEIRNESFNEKHRDMLMYESPADDNHAIECDFHFFTPGMVIPYGIEQPGATKKPSTVGVWWSESRQFTLYCLTKPVKAKKSMSDAVDSVTKARRALANVTTGRSVQASRTSRNSKGVPPVLDLAHVQASPDLEIKADAVWAQAENVTASAMSDESSLIAIGLQNGIVTIWDKYLGIMRKTVNIGDSAVVELIFLDPSICPQGNNSRQCYPTSTSCYVLVRCKDSSLHIINCGMMDYAAPILLSDKAAEDDNVITCVRVFPKIPEILLRVHKDGTILIQDILTTNILCEVALPSTHSLAAPWAPIIGIGSFGQMLYIKGAQKNEDEPYVDNVKESVFVFQLRSFPTLDTYWLKKRPTIDYITPCSMETRVNNLLTQRVKGSSARQHRLQERWPLMKQELLRVIQIKSH